MNVDRQEIAEELREIESEIDDGDMNQLKKKCKHCVGDLMSLMLR